MYTSICHQYTYTSDIILHATNLDIDRSLILPESESLPFGRSTRPAVLTLPLLLFVICALLALLVLKGLG